VKRNHLFVCQFFLDRSESFLFYMGTKVAGISVNNGKFGMLCANHIYIVRV